MYRFLRNLLHYRLFLISFRQWGHRSRYFVRLNTPREIAERLAKIVCENKGSSCITSGEFWNVGSKQLAKLWDLPAPSSSGYDQITPYPGVLTLYRIEDADMVFFLIGRRLFIFKDASTNPRLASLKLHQSFAAQIGMINEIQRRVPASALQLLQQS